MLLNTLKKLFFSMFFLFLPLIVFAQSNRVEIVALVPFWGPDEQFIDEFGEELEKAVNNMQGYRSTVIDMTQLPDDVPEGGFPPYICPSPSLTKTNPIAMTGEMDTDEDDDELWILRLYLWDMPETRLVFSDKVQGYDREEIAMGLPGTLDFMFQWLTKKRGRSGADGDGEGDLTNQYGGGKQVFITTAMPLHWMYVGARFGWTPLRLHSYSSSVEDISYRSINGAVTFSIAFFPESVPFFSRFCFQAEGVFSYDMNISRLDPKLSTLTLIPTALLKCQVYRRGNTLLSVFAGSYVSFPLGGKETIKYAWKLPMGLGITAGVSLGGKLDPVPGIFFFDVRASMDLLKTIVTVPRRGEDRFRRMGLTISVGYEYGLITKK